MDNTRNLEQPITHKNTSNKRIAWLSSNAFVLLAYAVLLIGGAGLRLATWERFLPYVDYKDEAVYVALGEHFRGLSDQTPILDLYGSNVPAYVFMVMGFQEAHDALKTVSWDMPAHDFPVLRLASVACGILTILVLAWAGTMIGGKITGFFAGAVWAFSPLIVDINSFVIPDPLLYLISALAIATAIAAWKYRSPVYLLISLLMGIAGIYIKFWVALLLIPFFVIGLFLFVEKPRKMLLWGVLYAVIALSTAAYMIIAIDPLGSSNKMSQFGAGDLFSLATDPARLLNNWQHLTMLFGEVLFLPGLIGGAIAFIWNLRKKRRTVPLQLLALLLIYVIAGFLLTTAISNITVAGGRFRHLLPVATGFMLLWAACIWQITVAIRAELQARQIQATIPVAGMLLVVVGGMAWHYTPGNLVLLEKYQQEHVVNVLRHWFDISVPQDGTVMQPYQGELDRTWNRWWGAYDGNRPFEYWSEEQDEILASTPQDYVDRNITYFIIGELDFIGRRYNDPALRDWLDQLTLVKTFDTDTLNLAGSTSYVYRMLPPQHDADFNYGDTIVLDGYDISATELAPGDTLTFRPYWRILQPPGINYTMFIHLYPADEFQQVAQYDGQPVADTYPTGLWQDTEELYIGRDVQLTLPEDIATGDYRLAIGLYDVNTLQRLTSGADEFFIIPVTIE